ncbi:hypothetical protein P9G49_07185 [Heyndrickxia coagulans]|uniref:hypothetical protein n=1 Tax=Heyndrickxia coagulans TaxID=1398 RepID=UPI002E0924BD|nr:hypothetical protein [Heyndrickxia coagulans]
MNIEKQCKEALERFEGQYYYIGIRFEDKEREIGDVCECSKHNIDREDEREFPEYGTPEYDEMLELDGTSAWNLETYKDFEGGFNTYCSQPCLMSLSQGVLTFILAGDILKKSRQLYWPWYNGQ